MQLDIVNSQNQKVGALDLNDDLFAGRVNGDLIWESVTHANAKDRRGTHKTKNRANVSGSGKKPWRQKGTGRARVGSSRTPLWRHGGTVFGPQPRSYDYHLSRKVVRGALRAALAQKLQDRQLVVVDALGTTDGRTKTAVEMLKTLGVAGKALIIDVALDQMLSRSVRNIPGVLLRPSARVTARDIMNADRVVATKGAMEKLQEVLA